MKSVPSPPSMTSFWVAGWPAGSQSPQRMSLAAPPRSVSEPWRPSSSSERLVPAYVTPPPLAFLKTPSTVGQYRCPAQSLQPPPGAWLAAATAARQSVAGRAMATLRNRRIGRLDLVARQQLAPDDHALDLRRALADQQQRRVAVQPLDLVLLRVAVAAVDAEAVLDDLLAGLGGEQLRHPGLEVRALARVLHARGLEREQPRGLHLRGHVGELELDRLVLGDRLP